MRKAMSFLLGRLRSKPAWAVQAKGF